MNIEYFILSSNCTYYYLIFCLTYFTENSEITEAKLFFESNYSHIYYIFYDVFIYTENNLKQRGKDFQLIQCFPNVGSQR